MTRRALVGAALAALGARLAPSPARAPSVVVTDLPGPRLTFTGTEWVFVAVSPDRVYVRVLGEA